MVEPEVIESIKTYRSTVNFYRALKYVSSAVFPSASIGIILYLFISGRATLEDAAAIGGIMLIIILRILPYSGPLFRSLLSSENKSSIGYYVEAQILDSPDPELLRKFQYGLGAASIAFGVPTPELVVISLHGVTSFAFRKNKRPVVAVTEDALNADLSIEEADAIMAERLAHVVIGDTVRVFNTLNYFALAFMLIVTGFFCGVLFPVTNLGGANMKWYLIIYIIFGFISLAWLYYPSWMLEVIKSNRELLTDSIAAKITGNPTVLKEALLKLDDAGLMEKVETLSDYENAMNILPRDKKHSETKKPNRSARRLSGLFSRRIENLEAIEKGQWSAFDIEHGTIAPRAFKWQ